MVIVRGILFFFFFSRKEKYSNMTAISPAPLLQEIKEANTLSSPLRAETGSSRATTDRTVKAAPIPTSSAATARCAASSATCMKEESACR